MKSARGFTLIEVLVAAGILGIVATALFGLLSRSLSNLRKVEELHQYELAAQDVMNRIFLLTSLPAPAIAEGSLDNLGRRLDGNWTVHVDPWAPSNLEKSQASAVVKVHVAVTWRGPSGIHAVELESLKGTKIESYDLQSRIAFIYPQ